MDITFCSAALSRATSSIAYPQGAFGNEGEKKYRVPISDVGLHKGTSLMEIIDLDVTPQESMITV